MVIQVAVCHTSSTFGVHILRPVREAGTDMRQSYKSLVLVYIFNSGIFLCA